EDPPVARLAEVPRPGLRHRREPGHGAGPAHRVHQEPPRRPPDGAPPDRLDAEGPHAPQHGALRPRGAAARPRPVARPQGSVVAVGRPERRLASDGPRPHARHPRRRRPVPCALGGARPAPRLLPLIPLARWLVAVPGAPRRALRGSGTVPPPVPWLGR